MAECAAQCSSIASSSCISCLGGSYQQCKGCFKREEAVLQSNFEEGEFNGFKKKNYIACLDSIAFSYPLENNYFYDYLCEH